MQNFWEFRGLELYYGIRAENKMEFYSIRTDDFDEQKFGEMENSKRELWVKSVSEIRWWRKEYILAAVFIANRNDIFGGGIYRIDYDGEVEHLRSQDRQK